jgi:uncharacterized protein
MKKILALSDTHGNHDFLRRALEQVLDADYVFHLGDDFEDLNRHQDLLDNKIVLQVPGIHHPYYLMPTMPTVQSITICNWTFALAHVQKDFSKNKVQADVYLYGHTHHPALQQKNKAHFLNPGHLKNYQDRGFMASFSTLDVSGEKIIVKIYTIDSNLFLEKTLLK